MGKTSIPLLLHALLRVVNCLMLLLPKRRRTIMREKERERGSQLELSASHSTSTPIHDCTFEWQQTHTWTKLGQPILIHRSDSFHLSLYHGAEGCAVGLSPSARRLSPGVRHSRISEVGALGLTTTVTSEVGTPSRNTSRSWLNTGCCRR